MSMPENAEDARRAQENMERERMLLYSRPSLTKLQLDIERNILNPEKAEIPRNYKRAGVELMGPLRDLQVTSRIRFVPNEYSVIRLDEMSEALIRDFSSAGIEYSSFEEMNPDVGSIGKLVANDEARTAAFMRIEKHSWGFKRNYFDNKNQQMTLVTGRLSAAAGDDFADAYGELAGLQIEQADKTRLEMLRIPEGEFLGEQVRRMAADMEHFEDRLGAMERFNPFKPKGQEMPFQTPEIERELLGTIFAIPGETEKITVNDKSFYINLLTYYNTVKTVKDRQLYEASMKAMLEVGALDVLKSLTSKTKDELDHNSGENEKFESLKEAITETRDRIIKNWRSPLRPVRARLADYAYEQGNTAQVASLNIAEITIRNKWFRVGDGWDFEPEVPGPETGQDAINGTNALGHEAIYKLKARGITNNMPFVDVNDEKRMKHLIKFLYGQEDNNPQEMKKKILADPDFARGAAILGLYPGENGALNRFDLDKVAIIRGDLKVNPIVLRVLRNLLWEFPIAVGHGKMLPMPIKPALDSFNLWKIMRNEKTKESVFQTLQREYGSLTDVDWNDTTWYAADAWEVNMKMLNDVLATMYGRQDSKANDALFGDPTSGLGEIIKKLDIGGRSEGWKMWMPAEDGSGKLEEVEIPKGVLEITYAAYLIVTHLAMVEHGIWDGDNWIGVDKESFWNGDQDKKGIDDWIQAALYTPETKVSYKFNDYRGSLVLLIRALAEWYVGPAPTAQDEYTRTKGIRNRVNEIVEGRKTT